MDKFLRDLLTEKDGQTYELQRVFLFASMWLAIIGFFWGCALETWHVYKTGEFDMPAFFQGIAYLIGAETLLLGGGGAAIFFKSKTENPDGSMITSTEKITSERTVNAKS